MVEEYVEPGVEDAAGGGDEVSPEPRGDGSEASTGGPAPIGDRYRIGEYLATSRLGRTYRAWDSETDQDVEITFLDDDAVTDAAAADAWLEGLRVLRHLHVLPLLDWEFAPVPYLVYAAPEMRLDRLIAAGVALSPSQTLLTGLQAAETLHNLRQHGITHGALTPWHLCLDANGRVRLAELGVDFLRAPRGPADTTRYDAPELIRVAEGERPDPIAAGHTEPARPGELGAAETAGPPGDSGLPADDTPEDAAPESDPRGGVGEGPDVDSGDDDPPDAVADGHDVAESSASVDPSPPEAAPPDPAPADVYALGVALAEAVAGRPVAPAEISRLGRANAPPGAGAATARHLSRLVPPLVQATLPRPEQRLEADELALALRATAEMLPPPARLDEAFERAGAYLVERDDDEAPAAASRPARGRWLNPLVRVAAAAAVVVAAAFLVILTAGGDGTPSHAVPDVVGMSWLRANDTLTASGWEVRRLEVRVPDVAAGEVVGQLPEPGGLLDEGQVVKVQVSLGAPLVVIPADIVGMPVAEAGLRLSEIGLQVGIVRTQVDPAAAEGSVVAIDEPLPELPRGSQVDLVIAVAR